MRNRSHPEGSLAEGYIANECVIFCSWYLHSIEMKFNKLSRNYDDATSELQGGIFSQTGHTIGKIEPYDLDRVTKIQAHRYVLFNYPAISMYLE